MKNRHMTVFVLLTLFVISGFVIPQGNLSTSDDGLPTLTQPNTPQEDFALSDDGDPSDESITSFSETTADDVLQFPDAFKNSTAHVADSVGYVYGGTEADWIKTLEKDADSWETWMTFALWFDISAYYSIEGFDYSLYVDTTISSSTSEDLWLYNHDSGEWDDVDDLGTSFAWYNDTIYDPNYWNSTSIGIKLNMTDGMAAFDIIHWDYAELQIYYMTLADDNHYAESFAGVSDWSYGWRGGVDLGEYSVSSDGDVATFTVECDDAGDEWVAWYYDVDVSEGDYFEACYKTDSDAYIRFYIGGHGYLNGYEASTDWKTLKVRLTEDGERIRIYVSDSVDAVNTDISVYLDLMRVGPADESGFSHDGSTTQGFDERTLTLSSDGDTLNISNSGASDYSTLWIDPTSTHSSLSDNYYPMIEWSIGSVKAETNTWLIKIYDSDGTSQTYGWSYGTGIFRLNLRAVTDLDNIQYFRIYCFADQWFTLEYLQIYSVANFTIDLSANIEITEYLYVEDGSLKSVKTDSNPTNDGFTITPDVPPSVNTTTFNVWNITVSDITKIDSSYGYYFRPYNPSSLREYHFDETRGDFLVDATMTLWKLFIRCSMTLSALTFIEDGTAPTVVRTNNAPTTPDTSSSVTLSSVVTDPTEVYSVSFDAISYPSGFEDTLYVATETIDNLWTYTFTSALPEGYYCFKVVASDGANINDLTSDSYVDFTIEQRSLISYIRIFDTLGDWVPFETFEVYRNSSRQYTDTFSSYTDEAWTIQVKDRFGETLNTTTFAAATEELVIVVNIHSLKIQSWYEDYVFFNLTRSGITYREVIAPLEIVNFKLYQNTYTWIVDYRNETTVEGETTLTSSTCIIVTGSTISDVAGYSQTLLDLTTSINITLTSTNNQVLTISVDLTNINTTINTQLIQVLLDISNTNTTVYQQTVDLLAAVQNTNTTIYNQLVQVLIDIDNMNSTLYSQTVTMLANIANLDSDIVDQTIELLASIENVNSTITAQTVTLLASISNMNATIYNQTVTLLANISNVNTTLYTQTVSILTAIYNFNSTIYNQTVSILTYIYNTNSKIYSHLLNILSETDDIDSALVLIDETATDLELSVAGINTNFDAMLSNQVYNLIVITGVIVLASIFAYGYNEARKEYKRYQRAVRAGGS